MPIVRRVSPRLALPFVALLAVGSGAQAQTIIYSPNTPKGSVLYTPYSYPVTVGTSQQQGQAQQQRQMPYNPFSPPSGSSSAPSVSLPQQGAPDDVVTQGRARQDGAPAQGASGAAISAKNASSPPPAVSSPQDGSQRVVAGLRLSGAAKVLDGNTLSVAGETVVLNGADAPERGQTCKDAKGLAWECGRRASDRLAQLVEGKSVVCIGVSAAKDGIAATCRIGNLDLGRTMVAEGLALVPRRVAPIYLAEEASARADRKGVWTGTFKTPWDVRAGK